jgi:hypothetical protein
MVRTGRSKMRVTAVGRRNLGSRRRRSRRCAKHLPVAGADADGEAGPSTLCPMSEGKADPKLQPEDPWRANEEARRRRLREDGRRPLAVNLAEGLALSEFLSTFTGSARRR